ncbi:MAG: hypothetical protein CO186_11025 [Zetaproteobacteria bacterium CG_4_9_14_3_um_filter_49_83]|nr:MAG: hypothetical protein AUJ56_08780 [Zetaproteobacteria bacterium CG1_02_49_23]PIQ32108.1 MAG: hypothetical protein COW62_08220 [Zetaproteobacteria bacterium CG17_big_fil_post_rev_8_21_14_2_50_50_13]PIV31429.1 MAG: hypothetical protein COS35_01455 [Zetaproteobacteria bacterium CG02_land_8_20_14_3_00_50_9]PIY54756.1 MAG: hypothetical protein COZ00_13000 [Zetaproteobacteria bacterium CG_4_10_14_0_8_um_filter_49_80]PJA34318.1 MAG: hypothetical protein CO186_11025 [Zetaproteobacteria bacterium
MNRFFRLGLTHRWPVLLVILMLTALAVTGLPRLTIDTGINSMIADGDPNRLMYEAVTEEFGSDNQTLIFVRDSKLWTPAKLNALKDLHFRLMALDAVQTVDDIFTLRSLRGSEGSIRSQVFVEHIPDKQKEIDRLKNDILYNPLIKGNLVSESGQALAMMVALRPEVVKKLGHEQVYATMQQAIVEAEPSFERIFQIGSPRIQKEMEDTLFADMRLLAPLSALVLVLVILLFLRSAAAGVIPLVTAGLSLVWTLGMMGWMGIPLNILSAMLPTLIIVIGSTEDTHLISAFLHASAEHPEREREFHVRRMLRKLGVPLLLTVLTTALGFAGNMFSSIDLIRDFAMASTFAMLANGAITLLLLPILLVWMGAGRVNVSKDFGKHGLIGRVLELNQHSHATMQKFVLFATLLLCVFFLYQASKMYVTNDPMSYFNQERPLIQDAEEVHQHLAGIKVFFITLQSNREQAFLHPKNLQKLADIESFIARQNVFDRSISLADFLMLLNREFHGGRESWQKIPSNKDMVSQYLMMMHRQDLNRYVSHDYRRATIVVRYNISDSNVLNRNIAELRDVARDIAGTDMQAFVVGENLMINESAETLLLAQVKSLVLLLLIIFILMSVMFTSIKGGIIAMVPSLIPIILMFGVMGLLDIPLNPGTAMVAVIAIGIAVDSTIHMLSRYNALSRIEGDAVRAAHQTVREEALPMMATSVALALGFGMLLFSDFAIIAQFGALSAATMLFALFANLIVTPLIMSRVRLVGLYDIMALNMDKETLRHCVLFRGMSSYQIRKAVLISEMLEFTRGAKIIEQGQVDRSMYLLVSGEVDVVLNINGNAQNLATLNAGEVFGEIGFVRETKRTADVVASSAVTVLKFDYERLAHDLKYFPRIVAKLNFNISYVLGERLAEGLSNRQIDRQPKGEQS